MKSANETRTALILIDIQRGFDHPSAWGGARNNPDFESNVTSLIDAFRNYASRRSAQQAPHIIHIHHHSLEKGSALHPTFTFTPAGFSEPILAVAPQPYAAPITGEPVFVKSVNSSFIGTQLENYIRTNAIRQLVIAGLTTDHCVSTTTRMAANLMVLGLEGEEGLNGGGIFLVGDGTATFGKGEFDADTVHRVNLASLDGEFCRVVKTREVLDGILS